MGWPWRGHGDGSRLSQSGGTEVAPRGHGRSRPPQDIPGSFLCFFPPLLPALQGFSASNPEVSKLCPAPALPVEGGEGQGLSWEKRDREFHENSVENSQPKAELDSCAGHGGIHRDGIPRASVAAPSLELSQARKMGIVSQFYPKPFQDSGMLT